jgi:hypothetical protein
MANVDLTIAHWENVAATRKAVLEIASGWIGTTYLSGENSKDGISHFVYQVLNAAREKVANTAEKWVGSLFQLVSASHVHKT